MSSPKLKEMPQFNLQAAPSLSSSGFSQLHKLQGSLSNATRNLPPSNPKAPSNMGSSSTSENIQDDEEVSNCKKYMPALFIIFPLYLCFH